MPHFLFHFIVPLVWQSKFLVFVCHLVIDGSSQWVIGRSLTRKWNIKYIDSSARQLSQTSPIVFIKMYDFDNHNRIEISGFRSSSIKIVQFTASLGTATFDAGNALFVSALKPIKTDRSSTQKTINRVQKHVCSQAIYSDICTLLQRNNVWFERIQRCNAARAATKTFLIYL